jgi:hypothetical protein
MIPYDILATKIILKEGGTSFIGSFWKLKVSL